MIIDNIRNTEIAPSNVHGHGLFCTKDIPPHTVLCELDGQVIPAAVNAGDTLAYEWNALPHELLLVRPVRTKYSYINHSRVPNVEIQYTPIRVVSLRQIKQGEELFLDYRKEPLPKAYLSGHGADYL